jgi:hypothetical protein
VNGTAQEASVHHYYWPKESDEWKEVLCDVDWMGTA